MKLLGELLSLIEAVEPKWYIVNRIGSNMTGHTSKPCFDSEQEAKEYQKRFSHAPGFKTARIQFGTSDMHGFITPVK